MPAKPFMTGTRSSYVQLPRTAHLDTRYDPSVSWVDVTTAVGTAGAAVAAVALGLRAEWRSIRSERRQAESDERRQAIHVAAWILVERQREDGTTEIDPSDPSIDALSESFDGRGLHIYAVIQNASDEPVWDVTSRVPGFVPKSKESDELKVTTLEDEYVVIGPHETHKGPITATTIWYNRLPIEIDFRDNAGRDWHRDDRGRLHPGRKEPSSWAWMDELEKGRPPTGKRDPEARRMPMKNRASHSLHARLSILRIFRRRH